MNNETVKGFRDFVGDEAKKREKIAETMRKIFQLYGFEPAETPIIEYEEFVQKENPNDEAVRDMFKLQDRGERKLALRYEFTFQLKRIAKNQKLPYKRYQIGYNFRDEPIRKGRTRQLIQCDVDVVGSTIKDEAEILKIAKEVFEKINIPIKIYVNNRKLINEILVSENIEEKNREQVIRELDKLDKLSKAEVADNLKKIDSEKILKIFEQKENAFEKYNFYNEIKELKKYCKSYGVEVEFRPFLARGLSYYNGTVFEVWSKELNVSIAGGGSYLIKETQSTGISFGLEPISLITKVESDKIKYQIISIEQDEEAIELAEKLRKANIDTLLILDKTIGKAIEYANVKGVEKVIFVGKEEIKKKKFKVRDMKSGKEEMLDFEEIK
ncbi:MAG: ATP phosphoribosyltransferase regulatory subunit [Nanoarchaeota archaeon]|nr:ATP phosphoribosyltransferase regulatory subunit [Nanoarchaeota archaeon]